jgi:hypothetical protein
MATTWGKKKKLGEIYKNISIERIFILIPSGHGIGFKSSHRILYFSEAKQGLGAHIFI